MEIISLIIPFIAISVISLMVDELVKILEEIMHKIPYLPDQFEKSIAYFFVLIIAFVICWQGNFDFFAYLGLTFLPWQGWLTTAMVISGGSPFVRKAFSMIETIPGNIAGVTTSIKNKIVAGSNNNINQNANNQINEQSTVKDENIQENNQYNSSEQSTDESRYTDNI